MRTRRFAPLIASLSVAMATITMQATAVAQEGLQHPVAPNPPKLLHLRPGHGLVVGHRCQGLHRRAAQTHPLALGGVPKVRH